MCDCVAVLISSDRSRVSTPPSAVSGFESGWQRLVDADRDDARQPGRVLDERLAVVALSAHQRSRAEQGSLWQSRVRPPSSMRSSYVTARRDSSCLR